MLLGVTAFPIKVPGSESWLQFQVPAHGHFGRQQCWLKCLSSGVGVQCWALLLAQVHWLLHHKNNSLLKADCQMGRFFSLSPSNTDIQTNESWKKQGVRVVVWQANPLPTAPATHLSAGSCLSRFPFNLAPCLWKGKQQRMVSTAN